MARPWRRHWPMMWPSACARPLSIRGRRAWSCRVAAARYPSGEARRRSAGLVEGHGQPGRRALGTGRACRQQCRIAGTSPVQGPGRQGSLRGLVSLCRESRCRRCSGRPGPGCVAPIDVLVLGMGDDGHTASLFPASPNLPESLDLRSTHRCLPMLAPSVPRQRLSMTRALLASAGFTALSVQGLGKLATLRAALAAAEPTEMPIRAFLHDPWTSTGAHEPRIHSHDHARTPTASALDGRKPPGSTRSAARRAFCR